ncbi:MAG TPA: hypothetical protein VHV30_01400 [Polyangiaceae bacterium]|jgi:hypothetical protein|nr:hypothetical protein [Polyangiaceae bacterium]
MSISNKNQAQAAFFADVQALIAGIQKHFPNGQFTFGNTVYTTASLVAILQDLVAAYLAMSTARSNTKDALTALRTKKANAAPIIGDLVDFLRVTFRDATAQLGDFGLQAPRARTPITGEKRVAATAKARATRIARGTASKKQKLAITGDVTGVNVTPITTPAPAPSPAPVAPASPAGATPPASTITTAPAVVVAK